MQPDWCMASAGAEGVAARKLSAHEGDMCVGHSMQEACSCCGHTTTCLPAHCVCMRACKWVPPGSVSSQPRRADAEAAAATAATATASLPLSSPSKSLIAAASALMAAAAPALAARLVGRRSAAAAIATVWPARVAAPFCVGCRCRLLARPAVPPCCQPSPAAASTTWKITCEHMWWRV